MVQLPNILDVMTIPDPDAFRQLSTHFQNWGSQHQEYMQQLDAGHTNLKASWQGDGADAYSQLHTQMQQAGNAHQDQRQQASSTHDNTAMLLEAAQMLQDLALTLLAGAGIEFVMGFFTAGLTDVLAAPETAEAVATEGSAQASAQGARVLFQTGFKALIGVIEGWQDHKALFDIGGALLGGASGLAYGITHHESLGELTATTLMDGQMGFDAGKNLSSDNPISAIKELVGLGAGTIQYFTSSDRGNEDLFATIIGTADMFGGGGGDTPEENPSAFSDENPTIENPDENVPTSNGGDNNEPPNNNPPVDGNGNFDGGTNKPHQNTSDLDTLYQDAGTADQQLKEFATQFAEKTGGTAVLPPLKSMDRALEKIESDYNGDASGLLDISRGTIKYDTMEQVDTARAQIQSDLQEFAPDAQVVRVKDRFANPTASGYRDYLTNIRMSNGHIVELQIHLAPIEAVKAEEHDLYQIVQNITRNAASEGRLITPAERLRIDELNKLSQEIYRKALEGSSGP